MEEATLHATRLTEALTGVIRGTVEEEVEAEEVVSLFSHYSFWVNFKLISTCQGYSRGPREDNYYDSGYDKSPRYSERFNREEYPKPYRNVSLFKKNCWFFFIFKVVFRTVVTLVKGTHRNVKGPDMR